MYNNYFNDWLILNSNRFAQMGMVQNITINKGIGELPNPTVVAEHSANKRVGQVIVWELGFMDFEIVDFSTGEQIMWEHRDLEVVPDFDSILAKYFELLLMVQ
jgi:hypothetical protein